ncbi:hypothetical protein GO755_30625 [Spirosoma sp. HMF4905]|uniref:Uncharacterized protein n=1 Tax=Spirosoma arboris TaxID=2682092 RepID=A0A7K1SLH5_9BACT|nr:hypothetical protein [Spirosoma arboris]MVM34426.1 hypothetical protein [Spirosoma arboris]
MLVAIDETLLANVTSALESAAKELALSRKREESLRKELERSRLMTEEQTQEYLQRDAQTLRYYRQLGLDSIKIGQYRWYVKGVVDDWLKSGTINRHKKT